MVCKNCGNIVVKTDGHCKVCGEPIIPDAISSALEKQRASIEVNSDSVPYCRHYRSRLGLLLIFWITGYFGIHHAWMGNTVIAAEKGQKAIKHFLLCFVGIGIPLFLMDMFLYIIEFFAIIFGKYRTDYNGNPIVWIKVGKPKLD